MPCLLDLPPTTPTLHSTRLGHHRSLVLTGFPLGIYFARGSVYVCVCVSVLISPNQSELSASLWTRLSIEGTSRGQDSGAHHGLFASLSGLPQSALLPSPKLEKVLAFSQVCSLATL